MADMMSAQQHYDAGMTELETAARQDLDETERAVHAAVAQGHFQAGLLSAVLEDLAQQDKPDGST
jgi:hypothetical protein